MPAGSGVGAPVPAHAVREAAARGWLVAGEGRMTLSAAGAECLRRALADCGDPGSAKRPADAIPSARRARDIVAPTGERPGLDEAESPLGWLRRRKGKDGAPLIDDAQFAAGERLRADVFFAGLGARVTMDWGRTGAAPKVRSTSGGSASMLDNMVAARQRVDHAMRAVGPEMSGLLLDVCGFMKGLEVVELERGWPARSARIVLLHALSMLARHYGIDKPHKATPAGPARIRQWGADDFRPDLAAWCEPENSNDHDQRPRC